eukprot:RCo002569
MTQTNPEEKVKGEEVQELSEEDQKIKDEVEELVQKVKDKDDGLSKAALELLRTMLKTATGTVTSIPKPLKFLRTHYPGLKENFASRANTFGAYTLFADLLSLLAMSCATGQDQTECLDFKLKGDLSIVDQWGHEYIRHLAAEIANVYRRRKEANSPVDDLMQLVTLIVPFDFKHNSEPQACDLLLEVGRLSDLVEHCNADNYQRVCHYLLSCADYIVAPADRKSLMTAAHAVCTKLKKLSEALRVAMLIGDLDLVRETFASCDDPATKKQMAFQLASQRLFVEPTGDDEIDEIVGNAKLSELFLYTARDLNTMEPKTPEMICKTHVQDQRTTALSATISSHTQNLASTFVNAFANAAFCTDKLMTTEGNEWLHKNKDHRMMSAAASLGMIMLWDVDSGLAQVDKFLYSNEEYIKAGALMAVGVLHCGVRNECDPALALLSDYLENKPKDLRIAAIVGLGFAYAGSRREEISEALLPIVADADTPLDVCVFAALALGLVFVGTRNENIVEIITTAIMERADKEAQVADPLFRLLCLALGMLFMGQQAEVEAALVAISTLSPGLASFCELTVKTCAYAGTGSVSLVKQLMKALVEKIEKEEDARHQAIAVMGIGLVAMGEPMGAEMVRRTFEHILQYGEPVARRAVPLALALVAISNPLLVVTDTLSKLSHDPDAETSMNAIIALGLVGAGTNNARISNMLRQLSNYYAKEANHLFLVRISQGLLFMGKGLLTLSPFRSDRKLMNRSAVAGLLVVLHSCLNMKSLILDKFHFLLFYLVTAMAPRFLVTVDDALKPVQVSVRVGQAVDTVAVAGRPKTITGFQTHNTPVLLSHTDRAELATDKCCPPFPSPSSFHLTAEAVPRNSTAKEN